MSTFTVTIFDTVSMSSIEANITAQDFLEAVLDANSKTSPDEHVIACKYTTVGEAT